MAMINRELDGYFFRVERDGKWQNICWSDLTEEEMNKLLENRSVEWLKSLCIGLGKVIRHIGDTLDITTKEPEENEEDSNG